MSKLTDKQMKIVEATRLQGQNLIKDCDEVETGKIDAEEFEKRISKAKLSFGPQKLSFGGQN